MSSLNEQQSFHMMRNDGALLIAARGNLVASTVQGQRELLLQALEPTPSRVELNLIDTDQVDSLGITLILGLFKSCSKLAIPFSVGGVSSPMMRVFRLFNLQKLFPVEAR